MAELKSITDFLDRELRHADIQDYPGALNGLQLENSGIVSQIISAVDATLSVIGQAAERGPESLLLVHHGMFWQGVQCLSGAFYRKIKLAMDSEMAIYSSHLPLDVHPEWGNNALLASRLGLGGDKSEFIDYKGLAVGLQGEWQGSPAELKLKLESVLGVPVYHAPAGPAEIHRIGVATGGAGSEVAQAAAAGLDAFITGEGPHWSHGLAEELGIHLYYGGHYATETLGVQALGEDLAARFHLSHSFLNHPSGL